MKTAYYQIEDNLIFLVPQAFYDVNECFFDDAIQQYSTEQELQENMSELEDRYGEYEDFDEILECFRLGMITKKLGMFEEAESLFSCDDPIDVLVSKFQSLGWELKELVALEEK